jgi:hypothetical protein
MAIIQSAVERKLSALLGAKVTFQKFHVSPFTGTIEAAGVSIGDDEERPLLTIVLVRAEISIKRALKGEIVVKSVTVERPVVTAIRWSDGTSNLPRTISRMSDAPPPDDKTTWKLDVEKLFIIDGQVSLRLGTYELASQRVLMELHRFGGTDYSLTFLAEDVRRRDQEAMIGTVGVTGRITNAADLTTISEAGMEADLTIGDWGVVTFKTPRIRSLQGEIELRGRITLQQLIALLPPRHG